MTRLLRPGSVVLVGGLGLVHLHQLRGEDTGGYLVLLHLMVGLSALAAAVRLCRDHCLVARLVGAVIGIGAAAGQVLVMTVGVPGEGGGAGWSTGPALTLTLAAVLVGLVVAEPGAEPERTAGGERRPYAH
jgi:hypothetical protein